MIIIQEQLEQQSIFEILTACDNTFTPPLSSRTELQEYSKKLYKNAIHFIIKSEERIVGLSCVYLNTDNCFAFVSVICILPQFQRKGLGTKLTIKIIQHLKGTNISRIKLEVDKSNIASRRMFERIGFTIEEEWINSNLFQLFLKG